MPKKSSSKEDSGEKRPAYLRRGTHSHQELLRGADALNQYATKLKGLAVRVQKETDGTIEVDGTTKLRRGESLIKGFIRAVEHGLTDYQHDRGTD